MSLVFGVMVNDRAGMRNSPSMVKKALTLLRLALQVDWKLVEAALNLDDVQVLLSFPDGAGFARLRAVRCPKNCCTVPMACPT